MRGGPFDDGADGNDDTDELHGHVSGHVPATAGGGESSSLTDEEVAAVEAELDAIESDLTSVESLLDEQAP